MTDLRIVIVIIVDEGLKVADLDLLLAALALNQGIHLKHHRIPVIQDLTALGIKESRRIHHACVTLKEFLDNLVAFQLVVSDA